MNWSKGLWRLWIVATGAWLIAVAIFVGISFANQPAPSRVTGEALATPTGGTTKLPWEAAWSVADQNNCVAARTKNPKLGNLFECFDLADKEQPIGPPSLVATIWFAIWLGMLPPLAVLFSAFIGNWVLAGFRQKAERALEAPDKAV
jgi:hypothetical protein